MKIDLFKLNNLGEVTLDSDISFDESYYINAGIRKINNLHISGTIKIFKSRFILSIKLW